MKTIIKVSYEFNVFIDKTYCSDERHKCGHLKHGHCPRFGSDLYFDNKKLAYRKSKRCKTALKIATSGFQSFSDIRKEASRK